MEEFNMKKLDNVIKANYICCVTSEMDCDNCPYNECGNCALVVSSDIQECLMYLKELLEVKEKDNGSKEV